MGSTTGNHVSRNEVKGLYDMNLVLIPLGWRVGRSPVTESLKDWKASAFSLLMATIVDGRSFPLSGEGSA
jgi:hypothetical protein